MSNKPPLAEYLVISRGQWDRDKSPEEIQAAIDKFYVWHDRLVKEGKLKAGQRLARQGKLVSRERVTDGPFAEAKEVVGGYWFFIAASLEEAAALAAQNPCLACGLALEVRPIESERASAYKVTNETPEIGHRVQLNRSMPPGQVIPVLGYADVAEAAAWLCRSFGFIERLRIGNHRVQLCFGEGSVVVASAAGGAASAGSSANSVMVRIENADEHFARARLAGARIVSNPTTFPYGERQYTASDPEGHLWTFSQSVADVHPDEWGGTLLTT